MQTDEGNVETVRLYFLELLNQTVTTAMKLTNACSLEESYDKLRLNIKNQRHHFAYKSPSTQS